MAGRRWIPIVFAIGIASLLALEERFRTAPTAEFRPGQPAGAATRTADGPASAAPRPTNAASTDGVDAEARTAGSAGAIRASAFPVSQKMQGGQDGSSQPAPDLQRATRPVETSLTRAASRTFDLRTLPHVPLVEVERSEHEDPQIVRRMIGSGSIPTPEVTRPTPTQNAPAPSPTAVYEGLDRFNWGAGSPSDANGDVGPTHYIQTINTSIGVFRKSDGVRLAAFTFNTFMSQGNFGNLCDTNNFGDPVVLYDTFEDRWIITDFAFLVDGSGNAIGPAYQCFAASKTSDPVVGGWNFYYTQVTDGLHDYEKLGIWPDGLYMSANMFGFGGGAYMRPRAWAYNKAQMYAGAPSVQVVTFDLPSDDFSVFPSNARLQTGTPPLGTPNMLVSTWKYLNAISVYKFHVDWNRTSLSTLTGPTEPTAASGWPNASVANAAQPGTATTLDTLALRAMVQNQYTNFGGTESLWFAQTVRRGDTSGLAAPRWYQANVTGGTVTVAQAATWDPDGANVINRFMPSLALDRAGNMAMGYTTSSASAFPSIKYAGRLAADPINTLSQTEQTFFAGTGSQTGSSRWGDYSSMTLDPNGCTFWWTSQYANPADQTSNNRWLTKFGSIGAFPGCTPVGAGGTVTGTITGGGGNAAKPGAIVRLGARTATANASGVYTFTNIPAGTYPIITASDPGYVTGSANSIVVTDGGTTTRNFTLASAPVNACQVDTATADFQTGTFSNVDVTTSAGNVTLLFSTPIDQSNTAGTTTGTGFSTTSWGGQTFTAGVSGTLTKVDVPLFCSTGTADCTGPTNLTVSIRNTSAGLPVGADLATATIPGFTSSSSATFTATFSSPPTLTSGTMYALIVRPVATPTTGGYFWIRASPSSYANGQRVTSADGGNVWTADSTRDFNFKTYMNPSYAASGNFVSALRDANPAPGLSAIWGTIAWTATVPGSTGIQFQVAASNNINGPFTFVGPNGTAATFFTSGASLSQFNGLRYLQYKAFLTTSNGAATPTLSDVTTCYLGPANTPAVTTASANEDTQTASGLVITRNIADDSSITHFKITNITNGSLFKNDGTTAITNNSFITFAEGNAGLKFTPSANLNSSTSSFGFSVAAARDSAGTGLSVGTATAAITITSIADAPAITAATTNEDTQTSTGLVISRNAGDSTDVTHFKITGITGGTLFKNNGTTAIVNNDFITFAEGNAGLKFTPAANTNGSSFSFTAAGATSVAGAGLGTGTVASITVTSIADTPSITAATTAEDTQNATGLVLTRNAADSTDVAFFKITGITGGTLFKNNGTTAINNNDFITFAEGNAGLKFLPAANTFSPGTSYAFSAAGATSAGGAGLGSAVAASISVTPVADTPTITPATTTMDVQTTSGLVISRNAADGAEVTHFQISSLVNGTLFKNNGTTPLAVNAVITFAEGNAGLKFTPAAGKTSPGNTFSVSVQAATSAGGAGASGVGTGLITVQSPVPVITTQPQSQQIQPGQSASLSVVATSATSYQWYVGASGTTTSPVAGATSASFAPAPTSTTSYWVRVTGTGGSVDSQTATVTVITYVPFTDNNLVAGTTTLRAVHITELQTRINVQRQRFGLSAFQFSTITANSTTIQLAHISQLRVALLQAYAAAGGAQPAAFTDPTLTAGTTVLKRIHIQELRDALVALESR